MFGMNLDGAKEGFFDRGKVLRAVDRAARKVLSRFGAFVRTRAQTSLRKRRGTSPPGQPPYSHVGLLKKLIYFAYDLAAKTVVIGPVLLREDSEAPKLLEHGGTAMGKTRRGRPKRMHYEARPFMGPAFDQEKAKLPALWKDSVRE